MHPSYVVTSVINREFRQRHVTIPFPSDNNSVSPNTARTMKRIPVITIGMQCSYIDCQTTKGNNRNEWRLEGKQTYYEILTAKTGTSFVGL